MLWTALAGAVSAAPPDCFQTGMDYGKALVTALAASSGKCQKAESEWKKAVKLPPTCQFTAPEGKPCEASWALRYICRCQAKRADGLPGIAFQVERTRAGARVRQVSPVLGVMHAQGIPSFYHGDGVTRKFRPAAVTKAIAHKDTFKGGPVSTEIDYQFARLDARECDRFAKQGDQERGPSYRTCMMKLAETSGDSKYCAGLAHFGDNLGAAKCAWWLGEQRRDLSGCFAIPRPANLEEDAGAMTFDSFTGCVIQTVEAHPHPQACPWLGGALDGSAYLSERCDRALAEQSNDERYCDSIAGQRLYDECLIGLVGKRKDGALCAKLVRPTEEMTSYCQSIKSVQAKSDECGKLPEGEGRDGCYQEVAHSRHDGDLCARIGRAQSDAEHAVSRYTCFGIVFSGVQKVERCRKLESAEARDSCFSFYSQQPTDESYCDQIDASYRVQRANCFLTVAVAERRRDACNRIDPGVKDPGLALSIKDTCLSKIR